MENRAEIQAAATRAAEIDAARAAQSVAWANLRAADAEAKQLRSRAHIANEAAAVADCASIRAEARESVAERCAAEAEAAYNRTIGEGSNL